MGYLIDSNAVIDYLSGQLSEGGMSLMNTIVNEQPIISIITQIEILGFNNEPEVAILLDQFIAYSIVVQLDDAIVKKTIEIRKEIRIKTPDAIIAATALILDYILITKDKRDFKKCRC